VAGEPAPDICILHLRVVGGSPDGRVEAVGKLGCLVYEYGQRIGWIRDDGVVKIGVARHNDFGIGSGGFDALDHRFDVAGKFAALDPGNGKRSGSVTGRACGGFNQGRSARRDDVAEANVVAAGGDGHELRAFVQRGKLGVHHVLGCPAAAGSVGHQFDLFGPISEFGVGIPAPETVIKVRSGPLPGGVGVTQRDVFRLVHRLSRRGGQTCRDHQRCEACRDRRVTPSYCCVPHGLIL
jgi:hypothetical protein